MRCSECGAPVPAGQTCQANFHALLYLEGEALGRSDSNAAGFAGPKAHFYAVAAYNLQHPDTQRLTVEALEGLRVAVREMLAGDIDIATLRSRNTKAHDGASRVTRRSGDPVYVREDVIWTVTVEDVLAAGPSAYCDSVERWARSVVDALDDADLGHSGTLNQ